MFILNVRLPRNALTEARGIVVVSETRDGLKDELQKLNLYNTEELEMAVELAREVGEF